MARIVNLVCIAIVLIAVVASAPMMSSELGNGPLTTFNDAIQFGTLEDVENFYNSLSENPVEQAALITGNDGDFQPFRIAVKLGNKGSLGKVKKLHEWAMQLDLTVPQKKFMIVSAVKDWFDALPAHVYYDYGLFFSSAKYSAPDCLEVGQQLITWLGEKEFTEDVSGTNLGSKYKMLETACLGLYSEWFKQVKEWSTAEDLETLKKLYRTKQVYHQEYLDMLEKEAKRK